MLYGKIFHEQANYFQEPEVSENKAPESELSSYITLTSVISGSFYTRYL